MSKAELDELVRRAQDASLDDKDNCFICYELASTVIDLRAKLEEAVESLEWYISEDETNEGDEPMEHRGGRTWNEINAYWIEGKRKAIAALAKIKGTQT